jgi:hypothetical protein
LQMCVGVNALALVLNGNFRKLGCLEWWWLGGIYSPQPPHSRWGTLVSTSAPDSPVRQPRHRTVRVLEQLTVGGLSSSGTGQSGAAPDRHYSLSDAPMTGGSDSARTVLHCSSDSSAFAIDRCAK